MMKNRNIIKFSLRFLKENNVYHKWVNNIFRQKPHLYCIKYKNLIDRLKEPYEMIDDSFTWSHTPQGHDFWRELNDELDSAYVKFEDRYNKIK